MPATKQQLHEVVDQLPEDQVDTAYRVVVALSLYDLDHQSETPELAQQLTEAIAEHERGESIPHQELLREFGLA